MKFGKIDGKTLLTTFWNEELIDYLIPNYIADSPNMAMDKIIKNTGIVPTIEGSNIKLIENIRKIIYDTHTVENLFNALLINAPHTHWDDTNPIIYNYEGDSNRYIIGSEKINLNKFYFPVSFVITENGLMPYEWCDESNDYLDGYSKIYDFIEKVSSKIIPNNYLGLSIAFRFKNDLFEYSHPTVEIPLKDLEPNCESEKSCIIPLSEYLKVRELDMKSFNINKIDEIGQVSWHSKSYKFLCLNKSEEELYLDLKNELERCKTDEEKFNLLKQIEDLL